MHVSLQWRHNGHDGLSNHQPRDCLLNCLFRCRSVKTSKLCVTGLCVGNSPVTGDFPAQMASDTENVFIWWYHNDNGDNSFDVMSDFICHTLARHVTLVTITGTTIIVPSLRIKSLQVIWRSTVDFIDRCPIFEWVTETWLHDRVPAYRIITLALATGGPFY